MPEPRTQEAISKASSQQHRTSQRSHFHASKKTKLSQNNDVSLRRHSTQRLQGLSNFCRHDGRGEIHGDQVKRLMVGTTHRGDELGFSAGALEATAAEL